jgi:hypothetical protein
MDAARSVLCNREQFDLAAGYTLTECQLTTPGRCVVATIF